MLELFKKILGFRRVDKKVEKVNEQVSQKAQEASNIKESWMQDVLQIEQDIRKVHKLILRTTAYKIAKRTGNLVK